MTAFLSSISDFFSAIGSFVFNIVHGLVYLVTLIPQALAYITVLFGYIPAPVLPFATCAIAVCITYLLVDR